MSILDKARRDLEHAQAEARKTAAAHRASLAKMRQAEKRVQHLEFAVIEYDLGIDRARHEGQHPLRQ